MKERADVESLYELLVKGDMSAASACADQLRQDLLSNPNQVDREALQLAIAAYDALRAALGIVTKRRTSIEKLREFLQAGDKPAALAYADSLRKELLDDPERDDNEVLLLASAACDELGSADLAFQVLDIPVSEDELRRKHVSEDLRDLTRLYVMLRHQFPSEQIDAAISELVIRAGRGLPICTHSTDILLMLRDRGLLDWRLRPTIILLVGAACVGEFLNGEKNGETKTLLDLYAATAIE